MVKSLLAWIDNVVMPFRCRLTAPAQVILDKELLKLMHMGKGKSYADMSVAADGFCDQIEENTLLSGNTIKPSELKRRYPELFRGGRGLRLDTVVPPGGAFVAAATPVDAMHLFGRCAGKPNGPMARRGGSCEREPDPCDGMTAGLTCGRLRGPACRRPANEDAYEAHKELVR